MDEIRMNTDKLLSFISDKFESKQLDNDSLVQLIELAGSYLNLKTLPNWAAENGKSYNGAKKQKTKTELFGVKFIIDNK